jgi:hypothetical protein
MLIMGNETPETALDARNSAKNFSGIETTLQRLEKSMSDFNKKMDDSVNVMMTKYLHSLKPFDNKIDGLRKDLKDKILFKIQQNETDIAANTSNIELNSKVNDLIVNGVPVLYNERASALYQKMSVALGRVPDQTPRVEVFRHKKKILR